MDARTLKALKGSIAKWRRIVAGRGRDNGPDNCPLCKVFNRPGNACGGCPVAMKTRRPWCFNSPYDDWEVIASYGQRADTPKLQRIAKRELKFLISLLP